MVNRPYQLFFPDLTPDAFFDTSKDSEEYNCVGWVLGDMTHWWDPSQLKGYYRWPPDLPRNLLLETYVALFEKQGFEVCADGVHEDGYLKIGLYASHQGRFKHVTVQLPNGRWSSKLGSWEDISHINPEVLEGPSYGTVSQYMRRALRTAQSAPSTP